MSGEISTTARKRRAQKKVRGIFVSGFDYISILVHSFFDIESCE